MAHKVLTDRDRDILTIGNAIDALSQAAMVVESCKEVSGTRSFARDLRRDVRDLKQIYLHLQTR